MAVDLKTLKIRQLVKDAGGRAYSVTAVGINAFLYSDGYNEHVVHRSRFEDWDVFEPPVVEVDGARVYVLLHDGTLVNEGAAWRGTDYPRVKITGYEVISGVVQ